jgi:hypothetical protein
MADLYQGLVHVLNDLSWNVGLELEVVVDLHGCLYVRRLQVLRYLVFYLVNESLTRCNTDPRLKNCCRKANHKYRCMFWKAKTNILKFVAETTV